MCKEFLESNRWKHFVGGAIAALFGTVLFALGAGVGMEFKDCQYDPQNGGKAIRDWKWDRWDWLDLLFTFMGGLVGQAVQIGIVFCIIYFVKK